VKRETNPEKWEIGVKKMENGKLENGKSTKAEHRTLISQIMQIDTDILFLYLIIFIFIIFNFINILISNISTQN
jgi:hypothetical protein